MNSKTQKLISLIFNKLKKNKSVKSKINKNEVEEFVASLLKKN